jgi:hypothetical protein
MTALNEALYKMNDSSVVRTRQPTRQYSFSNKMKYLTCGWLCLFRGTAIQKNDVKCSTFETGSSVLNHASCIGEASLRGSSLSRVGVNEIS